MYNGAYGVMLDDGHCAMSKVKVQRINVCIKRQTLVFRSPYIAFLHGTVSVVLCLSRVPTKILSCSTISTYVI